MFLLKLGSGLQNLVKKTAERYENIDKLQTAFPRSGMHNPSPTSCAPVFLSVFIFALNLRDD